MSPTLWNVSIRSPPLPHELNLLVLAQVRGQLDHTLLPELHSQLALEKD